MRRPDQFTAKELEAIEAVRKAVKALPRTVYLTVDDFDGTMEFWRRAAPGRAYGNDGVTLRCKSALAGP